MRGPIRGQSAHRGRCHGAAGETDRKQEGGMSKFSMARFLDFKFFYIILNNKALICKIKDK